LNLKIAFKVSDMLAYRRLRDVKLVRSGLERPLADYLAERFQLIKGDHFE